MATTDTAGAQTWDPRSYALNARFVADLGAPLVDLLSPRAGEQVMDLGCGDGHLTLQLRARGCRVLGVDSSRPLVDAARRHGLEAVVMDARRLDFRACFHAVFSNAALHWMKEADAVIDGVWRALRPGGRFVAEMGGHACVARVRAAIGRALARRGLAIEALDPWYFPTAEEYGGKLEARGFALEHLALFPRPTPLPGELRGWLETFAKTFLAPLDPGDHRAFLEEVQEDCRPDLCDAAGRWTADYTRLRFSARKPG
jgi:trans-aconitate methyltransferase